MRRIALFLLSAACLFAQSGLQPPVLGHYRDDAGRLIRLQGLPGALTAIESEDQEQPEALAPGWDLVREEGLPPQLLRLATGERFAVPMAEGGLTLYVRVTADREETVGDSFDFPATAPGETADIRFRVRNTGTAGVTVTKLALSGKGFTLIDAFSPPRVIAPGFTADFTVRFQPEVAGSHTAKLQINDRIYDLRAGSQPQPRVEVQSGGTWVALSANGPQDLGSVEQGGKLETPLRIVIPDGATAPTTPPTIHGDGFRLAVTGIDFAVWFEPKVTGPHTATLSFADRIYTLTATAIEAAPPKPLLSIRTTTMDSGRQEFLSIRLTAAARAAATGLLRMEFIPAASELGDDPSIVFLPAKNRLAAFSIANGSMDAMFNGSPQLILQTGATAGTIVLRMSLGAHNEEIRVAIAPSAVRVESPRASRGSNILEVTLSGIDNTRSAGKLGFRFYLADGSPVGGLIEVDAAEAFRNYYAANPTATGTFSLRASFLASGPVERLDSVEVTVVNKDGAANTGRLRF